MTNSTNDTNDDIALVDTSIMKLIKQWKEDEHKPDFNETEHLLGLCECLEREQTEFWGRDPDPFDERMPRKIPVAGAYADICTDIIACNDFILDLIMKYISTNTVQHECARHMLRFLCSVLNCCSLSIIFSEYDGDSKDFFYTRMFEWATKEETPINIYCTCIVGHITKSDDQVIPQRKGSYIKLIAVTMERLQTINKACKAAVTNNWLMVRQSPHYLDEGSNASLYDMPMSKIFGEWKLASPISETIQERLLIHFLRHIAEFETLMPSIYTGGVLTLMSSWLRGDRHDDIRLTFEALRLLMKLLCHRLIYTEFYEPMNGIQMLLSVPRPSVAANAVSFCLYNLLYYDEIVDKVILWPQDKLENLIKVVLWVIETCHPSARCYGMLCVQCLIRKPITLQIFDKLNGPRYILNSLAILPAMLSDIHNKSTRKDCTYFALLKTTLNTMKICLEQSLINWSMEVENADATGLLAFPSESEIPFTKTSANVIPLAMKLQTWKHPYISDRSNIIKIIYSSTGFFEDAFCNFTEIINSSLDILSLLCLSNKFVVNFLDFKESDTKATVKLIFTNIIRKQHFSTANHVKALKSILFFLSILCCRPLQGSRSPVALNKSTRKRRFDDMEPSSCNIDITEKVHISDQRLVTKITSNGDCFTKPRNTNQELQTKLWSMIRGYNAIPKLLKVLEKTLSPLDGVSVRTWVCHVLSGLSRCSDILLMLRKLPIFNKGVLENFMLETVTPERMSEHAEFCAIGRRLIRDLHGQTGSCNDRTGDMRPDQVRKAEIVGRTQIQYDKRELLALMHQHLQQEGLNEAADVLRREANLPVSDLANISVYEDTTAVKLADSVTHSFIRTPVTPKRSSDNRFICSTPKTVHPDQNLTLRPKLYRDNVNQTSIVLRSVPPITEKTTTLNDIVESFLRTQHAQCSNPISICPKFSLHSKHSCPSVGEPSKPVNMLHYLTKREHESMPRSSNNRMLRHYVHRNFKPRVMLNEADVFEEDQFSESFCFAKGLEDGLFFASTEYRIVFTDVDMAQASVEVGEVDFSTSNLENSRDGRKLMVSSVYTRRNIGVLTLFNVENRISSPSSMSKQHEYPFSGYTEFSKTNDRRFVVTQDRVAQIIDVETGVSLFRCSSDDSNVSGVKYAANRATFSYDDNLILSYGTLWDVRCAYPRESTVVDQYKHRFDNLEDIVSGVFHPNGHELIIGSAVWDIRTYRLLQNLPSLKSSRVIFNSHGDFFYTYQDGGGSLYSGANPMARGQNLFQCYDARDYSVVATVNTNKVIQSMAVDPKDLGVAVIESNEDGCSHGQCRVFSVGYKWSTSASYDYDDDVAASDDDDDGDGLDVDGMDESDLEFMAEVDFDDLMYSDSDDADSLDDDDEDDDGMVLGDDDEVDGFVTADDDDDDDDDSDNDDDDTTSSTTDSDDPITDSSDEYR